jgi:hypothetical protein
LYELLEAGLAGAGVVIEHLAAEAAQTRGR